MADTIKKFLDQEGVGVLWGKVVAKVNAEVKKEADRALLAEQDLRDDLGSLSTLVGTLPEGTSAKSVVDYVNVKTSGIATDAALTELQNQLSGVQGEVSTIKGDYLKGSDKTELSGAITTAVNGEKERAMAEEARLAGLIAAIDYVDEDELAAAIAPFAKSADVVATYETIANVNLVRDRVAELEAHDEDYKAYADQAEADAITAAKAYTDGVKDALLGEGIKDTFDTLVEIQDWIEGDGVNATELSSAIAAEAKTRGEEITRVEGLVSAEASRADGVEKGLDARIKAIEDADHDFGAADTALENKLMVEINKKANSEAMTTALAGKADVSALNAVSAVANAAATKTYVDEELAKKATVDALNGVSAVANAAATKTYVDTELGKKANQADLEAEAALARAAEKANSDAIAAFTKGSVSKTFAEIEAILANKQDTIPANTYDVHGAAAQALTDAKSYTDTAFGNIQALSSVDIENAIASASV